MMFITLLQKLEKQIVSTVVVLIDLIKLFQCQDLVKNRKTHVMSKRS